LPAWLTFDAATQTFSGTPENGDVGSLGIKLTATDLAGASASQTFALAVESGGNQPPVTALDVANVIEDRKIITWGNVLANDSDPEGDVLKVADAGIRRGEYGVLTLLRNGTYVYVLNDCSAQVQGLGVGDTVTETFGYLASDGTNRMGGELTVTVQGTNDKPELARRLQDVQLAKGKTFSWQIPADSFIDRDRTDTLTYTATLANGKPLPAWLKFDAATQTFSGKALANAKGNIEVRVTASDGHGACSTASDVFKISFGNGGCHGNEGVGNGEDPPPPGHDCNHNDGHGTSPGHPGNAHGGRDDDDGRGAHGWHGKHEDDDAHDGKRGFAYLDLGKLEHYGREFERQHQQGNHAASEGHEFYRRWAEMAKALAHDEKSHRDGWSDERRGADVSGFGLATAGFLGTNRGAGVDPVTLAGTSGTLLKWSGTSFEGFKGLQEGLHKL